jgi:hypothetical protein
VGRLIAAGAFLATISTSAHAGKILWTAPALAGYPATQTIYCDIVNTATTPQQVTVEILDYVGNVVGFPLMQTLPPEEGTANGDSTGAGARCRFTVAGSTKKVRAIAVYDDGSGYTLSVPAY